MRIRMFLLVISSLSLLAVSASAALGAARPTITLTSPTQGATYTQNQVVTARYSCAHATSCKGWQYGVNIPSGSPIDTSVVGSHAFEVIATNGGTQSTKTVNWTVTAPAAPPTPPFIGSPLPSISGSPQQGQTLTANAGAWNGTQPFTYTYVWSDGKTGPQIALDAGDVGQTLTVTVTAHNSAGSSSATSPGVGPVTAQATNPCPNGYVGITFDDGPTSLSQQYVDALNAGGAHATFFLIGGNTWDDGQGHMNLYPTIAQMEVANGNAIGDHTMDHESFTGQSTGHAPLTDAQITAEIQGQAQLAQQQAGYSENLFRPPYGDMNQHTFDLVNSLGFTNVMWTTDTNDWQSPPTSTIVSRFLAGATNQAVILQHDGYPNTLAAIPQELAGLKARGLCSGKIVPAANNPNNQFDYNGLPDNWQVVAW